MEALPRCVRPGRYVAWVWLALLLAGRPAHAQAPRYEVDPAYTVRQWTARDGLPTNGVKDVLLASDGYLWAATRDGLARFDGHHFTVYTSANTPALAHNRLLTLLEDPDGGLWIHGERGLVVRFAKGQFTAFDGTKGLPRLRRPLQVVGDTLWLATDTGLAFYHAGRVATYGPQDLLGQPVSLTHDAAGNRWVGTVGAGLYVFPPDGRPRHYADELPSLDVWHLRVDRHDVLWVGTGEGCLRIVGGQPLPLPPPHGTQRVHHLGLDAAGTAWAGFGGIGWWRDDGTHLQPVLPTGTAGVGLRHGPEGNAWRAIALRGGPWVLLRNDEPVFQAQARMTDFAFGPAGQVWIATGDGLFYLRRAPMYTYSQDEGLPGRNIYTVLEDRAGTLWLGTWGRGAGPTRLDGPSGRPLPLLHEGRIGNVTALYEDRQGSLWVATNHLHRWEGGRLVPVVLPVPALLQQGIRVLYEDRRDRFWIGGPQGLLLGQRTAAGQDRTWRHLSEDDGLPHNWVRAILETREGTLLFATNGGGIARLTEDATEDAALRFEALDIGNGLASDHVRDLYEDADGILWIATENHGLCRLDRRGQPSLQAGDLRCLTTEEGLYDNSLHRILEDDFGRLWLNTNRGLFWVERAVLNAFIQGEVTSIASVSYDEDDGMRSREGNGGGQPAGWKARDGRLWFPTQDGVVVVDPAEIPPPSPPRTVVEATQAGGTRHLAQAGIPLVLPAGRRDVAVQYTAIEFTRPEDVRFRTRLVGYDTTWQEVGSRRVVSYTNLSPGDYRFEVQAGVGGTWGTAAALALVREAHFWETWWFALLGAVFGLGLAFGFYEYRLWQMERQREQLARVVDTRTTELRERNAQVEQQARQLQQASALKSRFLANISHEFRTPLTLLLGPLDALVQETQGPAQARFTLMRRNARRLLRLINQLLDLARLDAGALRLRPGRYDLAAFLRQLAALFASSAELRGLALEIAVPDAPFPHGFDADKIEKVMINLLSNALKFTPAGGTVTLRLGRTVAGDAEIAVADTGPGIAPEHLAHLFDRFYQVEGGATRRQEGSGIGLSLVRELVHLHGGEVTAESTRGLGTTFTVRLPDLDVPAAQAPPPSPTEEPMAVWVSDGGDGAMPVLPPPTSVPEAATTVLIVEDNADLRTYLRTHLEDTYTIAEAADGAAGLAQARALVPDLIVSDVMMPEMDGLALCQALKTDRSTSHIPVVLLTARADVESRVAGLEEGAEAYLAKPFNAEVLRAQVARLIAERRRLWRRFAGEADPAETDTEALPPREAAFLEAFDGQVQAHLSDAAFGVDQLAEAFELSTRQLLRKVRALTGETSAERLRRMRLAHAAALLRTGQATAAEAADAAGFRSRSSFHRAFREAYGQTPSEYALQPPSPRR